MKSTIHKNRPQLSLERRARQRQERKRQRKNPTGRRNQ